MRGISTGAAHDAADAAIKAGLRGRSLSAIKRSLQGSDAGKAVAKVTGLEPGLRLRLPTTGGVGRAFANTPAGQRLGSVMDRLPFAATWREGLLNARVANIPASMRFGLDDDIIKASVRGIRPNRAAARQTVRAAGDMPPVWRPLKRRGAVKWEADRLGRVAVRGMDPRYAEVAGRVGRAHVEKAVPGMAQWGRGPARVAEALSKLAPGSRQGVTQPLLMGRLFGRADLPLTLWRNLPGPGGVTGAAGKAARMFKHVGVKTSQQLENILSPEAWRQAYEANPALAEEVQKGVTKFVRNNLTQTDEVLRRLLASGDPDQIARAWGTQQSLRYARGQVSFFREVMRRGESRLNVLARKGGLAASEEGERMLGRWLRAAVQGDVLQVDELRRVTGINRNNDWFGRLPQEVQDLPDRELMAYAQEIRNTMEDGSDILRHAFGEPGAGGQRIWSEEQLFESEEGVGYFPRRVTDEMKPLFNIRVRDDEGKLLRDAFEGGYRTAQSMRERSWKPASGVKLTKEGAAAANPKYVHTDASGQSWLSTGNKKKFVIKPASKAGLSVEDQIDDVTMLAFGRHMFDTPFDTLKSYGGGMGMQLGGESMMSHLKYTVGLDDVFRLSDDVAANFRRVAAEAVEEGDQLSLFPKGAVGAVEDPVWDPYTKMKRANLDKKLDSVRERTRRLYAVSQADFEEVVDANEALRAAVAGGPVEARRAAEGWAAVNEEAVRLFGEMEGITEEVAYVGARLNQIYVENEQAILDGTYRVSSEVRDLIITLRDRAARGFVVRDVMRRLVPLQTEFADGVVGANTGGVDVDGLEDMFLTLLRGIETSSSYLHGGEGYIGQFPVAVQQAKLIQASDRSIGDLLDLAKVLDPAQAERLADDAAAAGAQVKRPDPIGAGAQPAWAESGATMANARRGGVFFHAGDVRQETLVARPELHIGSWGAATERVGIPSKGNLRGESLVHEVTVTPRKPYFPGGPDDPFASAGIPGGGERLLDAAEHPDGNLLWFIDQGATDPNGDSLFDILREAGYDAIPYLNSVEAPGSLSYLIIDPSSVTVGRSITVRKGGGFVREGHRFFQNVEVVDTGPRATEAAKYKDWQAAYRDARSIDRTVGHSDFISTGVTRTINMDTAMAEMTANDDLILNLQGVVRFRQSLASLQDTVVGGTRTRGGVVGGRRVDIPEPLRGDPADQAMLDMLTAGRPMAEDWPVTPAQILEAATAARDDARLLFDEAAALRAQVAEINTQLQAMSRKGAGTAGTEPRILRERKVLLNDMATTAELQAQYRSREAAELLDVTRVDREVYKLEDFLNKADIELEDALDASKPFADRQATMNGLVDAVADGLSNFGPWRIASGNADLDANMIAAAEAFQRLLRLKDPQEMKWFLRKFDQLQNWFKAGVIATPGFVYRNMFGAFLNAYLDGVDLQQIVMAAKATSRINKKADDEGLSFLQAARLMAEGDEYMQDIVRLVEQGVRSGGQVTREATPFVAPTAAGDIPVVSRAKAALERGMTIGRAEEGMAPTGLKGPSRLVKTVWDVVRGRDRSVRNLGTVLPFGPGSSNFVLNRLIRTANSQVEDVVRLGVGMDTLRWGGSADDALDRIARSQFDYGELSSFESGVMRRIVPFYVWTRKNVPYQFAKLATNPAAYNRLMAVKKNMELGTEDEGLVPDWFLHPFGIRTPWSYAGARVYGVPDLPFLDLHRYDPTRTAPGDPTYGLSETWQNMLWQLTPLVKIPIEFLAGQRLGSNMGGYGFRGNWQELPAVLKIPGLVQALEATGRIRTRDGERQIQDHTLYFVMNALPQLTVLRRLVPSEERYQQRLFETIFGTLFGTGVVRQTPEVKSRWRNSLEYQFNQQQLEEGGGGTSRSSGGGLGIGGGILG